MLAHVLFPLAAADPHDTNNLRLVGKRFEYDELPVKVDTASTERGIQVGFNKCNSTTQTQDSMCQTIVVNSIDDFCIYIPPTLMEVGNAEAGMVAACTKPTHGARLIPQGALTAVQFLKSPSYVAVMGRLNQQLLNIPAGDTGGEVDSGGQDQRGNPIGAMAYSNALPFTEGQLKQSPVWHQFIGSDMFCMKLCDLSAPNAMGLCEHVFDTYGCGVNVPGAYKENSFESCDSDDQKPVQPGVTDLPATSNCVPAQSAEIYAGLPSVSGSATTTTPIGSSASGSSRPGSTGVSGSQTNRGGASASSTSTSTSTSTPGGSAAKVQAFGVAALVPLVAGLLGAAFLV
ncbi:hypothetical protein BKA62DRAFT_745729 [Auriculariales sp. MPI-PUGE-AT-0066]|nr:hypothetical protein BKA62DRAFT_745729 [Auriculariales sp. MPI-PUGE-AT-0066]